VYRAAEGSTPEHGLTDVRVSKVTARRVYFYDAAARSATDTLNVSLPASEFACRYQPAGYPHAR
jgi:hypothetical protein